MTTTTYTFSLVLQAQLGAVDRVLGALTHRGFIALGWSCRLQSEAKLLHLEFTLACEDEAVIKKLAKVLERQIYVLGLECTAHSLTAAATPLSQGATYPPTPRNQAAAAAVAQPV
jgi:acetolactate synthase regulatory subunit